MIPNLSDAALMLSGSPELSLIAKATLILLFGLTITQIARTSRASVRHVVIAASFATLVALPVVMAAAPAMAIEVTASPSAIPSTSTDPTRRLPRVAALRSNRAVRLRPRDGHSPNGCASSGRPARSCSSFRSPVCGGVCR